MCRGDIVFILRVQGRYIVINPYTYRSLIRGEIVIAATKELISQLETQQ